VIALDGFQRRKEKKKENICHAAFELFSTHGIQKVSMAEIAKKANVSQVTIYNYFGSKDELLRHVIVEFMDNKWKEFEELLESNIPFPQKIEQMIFDKSETAKMLNPEFLKSVMSNNEDIQRLIEDFYKNKALPGLMKIIEQGQKEGYVKEGISNEAILFYIHMFKEATNRSEFFSNHEQAIQMSKDLTTLFFYGLLGKPKID
jgi:AcrR family transcriptional regulator